MIELLTRAAATQTTPPFITINSSRHERRYLEREESYAAQAQAFPSCHCLVSGFVSPGFGVRYQQKHIPN
ncbi:MAG TPA: hypothetical protein VIV66_09920 [Pyrinomonadaceae bacterium]